MPRSSFALLAVVAVAALAVTVVGPTALADASPQPTPMCRFCGTQFADGAAEQGVNATVVESTVDVQVHENGTTTWTVRNRLGDSAGTFRENPALLDRTASALVDDGYGLPEAPTVRSTRMDGDTAVVLVHAPDAARREAGLLVFDALHDRGRVPWYVVNADRLTVSGPRGTVVTNDPEVGSVDGGAVTWHGTTGEQAWEAPALDGSPYVVFGPDRSVVTGARTTAALALATLPIVVRGLTSFVLPQTVVFALVLLGVVAALRRFLPPIGVDRLALAVGALGVGGVVVPVVSNGPEWVFGPPLFGIGLGVLAWNDWLHERVGTPRSLAVAAVGVLAVTFVVLVGVASLAPTPGVVPALSATALALPFVAMFPLGAALTGDIQETAVWWFVAVASFAAVPVVVLDLADPPSGLGAGILAVALFVGAVVVPVIGALVLAFGRALAVRSA